MRVKTIRVGQEMATECSSSNRPVCESSSIKHQLWFLHGCFRNFHNARNDGRGSSSSVSSSSRTTLSE